MQNYVSLCEKRKKIPSQKLYPPLPSAKFEFWAPNAFSSIFPFLHNLLPLIPNCEIISAFTFFHHARYLAIGKTLVSWPDTSILRLSPSKFRASSFRPKKKLLLRHLF